ncbi:hypothetical protein [Aeromicrobium sp. P5_D10]
MAWAALVVAILALIVSIISVAYTHRQTRATEGQAEAARSQDRRERRPEISVRLEKAVSAPDNSAVYYLRNNGPQDLDSVVVHRPRPDDDITYPVARRGTAYGDEADLGPIQIGQELAFVLCMGVSEVVPEFRVRVECRRGEDTWPSSHLLESPRFYLGIY